MDSSRTQPRAASARRSTRLGPSTLAAWLIGAPILAVLAIGTLLNAVAGGDLSTSSVLLPIAGLTSLSMGLVLVARLPRHTVGWLLWAGGLAMALTVIAQGLADLGLTTSPGRVPGAIWFAWLAAWVGGLALFVPATLLPLLYPTGQPPSPRWRPVVVATIVTIAAWSMCAAVGSFTPGTYPAGVQNPFAIGGAAGDLVALLPNVLALALAVLLVLAFTSVVVRYRRAAGIERQQIRWFAFVGVVAIAALLVAGGGKGITDGPGATIDSLAWLVGIGALAFMPIAIGTAILRYRLYDIDRIISRTIGWAVVTGVLVVVFAGAILLFQAVLAPLTGESTVAVAASTLLVATLFQPLRRRVQARVDRRFNRSRYDADRTVAAFAERLRDEVDLDQLGAEVRATVVQTVAPATVSLWLRE